MFVTLQLIIKCPNRFSWWFGVCRLFSKFSTLDEENRRGPNLAAAVTCVQKGGLRQNNTKLITLVKSNDPVPPKGYNKERARCVIAGSVFKRRRSLFSLDVSFSPRWDRVILVLEVVICRGRKNRRLLLREHGNRWRFFAIRSGISLHFSVATVSVVTRANRGWWRISRDFCQRNNELMSK